MKNDARTYNFSVLVRDLCYICVSKRVLKGWQSTIYDTYLKELSYLGLRSTTVFLEPGREGSSASSLHESGADCGWLGLGGALERVVVPRTFGAQPDGLVVVPGVILGRVCGRRGQCPLPPDAATTWPTAPTRRSTSSSPSSMQRSRGAPTACSAVRRRVVLVVLFW